MAESEPIQTSQPRPVEPDGTAEDDDRGYDVPNRPWLVHGAIVVAFAIFISMVLLLFVRWADTNAPNASLVFDGDAGLDRVEVRLDGPGMDKAVTQKLSAANNYRVTFSVPAGAYLVRVSRDGQTLLGETGISAKDGIVLTADLTKLLKPALAATAPATRPQ